MNYQNGEQDPYVILGVGLDADAGEIKAAYRRKSLLMHTDRDRSRGASERFAALTGAYHACLVNLTSQGRHEQDGHDEYDSSQPSPPPNHPARTSISNIMWLSAEEFYANRYGVIEKTVSLNFGSHGRQDLACSLCKGKGSYWKKAAIWQEIPCERCQQLKPQINIKIPQRAKDGTKLRVEADRFGVDLDVIIVVRHVFSD